jgi:hypothetical protein
MKIKITEDERDLILNHTFVDDEIIKILKESKNQGKFLIPELTEIDLEELVGFIAAESNHAEDKTIEKKLDKLSTKLSKTLDKSS